MKTITSIQDLLLRGKKFQETNKLDAAQKTYFQVLQQDPNNADALHMLGILYTQLHQYDTAIDYLKKATMANPHMPQIYHNLGLAYFKNNNIAKAIDCYQHALILNPNYYKALQKLASAYQVLDKRELAFEYFKKALAINQKDPNLWQSFGVFLKKINRIPTAVQCFEKAIAIEPNAECYTYLAQINAMSEQHEAAIACSKKALKLNPQDDYAKAILSLGQENLCDWQNYKENQTQLLKINLARIANNLRPASAALMVLFYPWKPEEISLVIRKEAEYISKQNSVMQKTLNFQFKNKQNPKLKIAYISTTFHDHPTSHLAYNLYANHDRNKFEVYAFSHGYKKKIDKYQQHFMDTCDHFINIANDSDIEAAKKIYSHEIDILIDLDGHIRDNRMQILALRPAPIQVSYLGFPGTTGANYIDYLIADNTVITSTTAPTYIENLVYMPHSYQINNDQQLISDVAVSRKDYGLPENAFVFCCFNQNYKIEPTIFSIWMEILNKLPNAVLWLIFNSTIAENNLRNQAKKYGVDPQRLIFAKKEEKSKHLARLRLADLFIDTHFCNAHTTASDALWAGVPVLTCPGVNFASRVAASLLNAVGLPELIVPNLEAYRDAALFYATHPEALQSIRKKLEIQRQSSPLFNTKRSVKNLENAYLNMWQFYQNGQAPQSFRVVEN